MFSTITLVGFAAFTGCKKSDNASNSGNMSESINGSKVSSPCYSVSNSSISTIEGFTASGTSASNVTITYPFIQLGFLSALSTGTFNIDGFTVTAGIDSSAGNVIYASSGTITITSITPHTVGTFSFTCSDGTTVTGGTFTSGN